MEVEVDDYLPCNKDEKRKNGELKLEFVDVSNEIELLAEEGEDSSGGGQRINKSYIEYGEFWPCLLEKAYAKLKGGYENMIGGHTVESLRDLAGAAGEIIHIKDVPENELLSDEYFENLYNCYKSGCMLTASATVESLDKGKNALIRTGSRPKAQINIVHSHAYTVTAIDFAVNKKFKLICVKNPWGQVESKGLSWNDDSDLWDKYPEEKNRLKNRKVDDGEFWLLFEHFVKLFAKVSMTYTTKEFMHVEKLKKVEFVWEKFQNDKSVVLKKGYSYKDVGSATNALERKNCLKFSLNTESDLVISFVVKYRRLHNLEKENIYSGMTIYKNSQEKISRQNLVYNSKKANDRENMARITLPAGDYIVVPWTVEPCLRNYEGYFRTWKWGRNDLYEGGNEVQIKQPKVIVNRNNQGQEKENSSSSIFNDLCFCC